MALKDAFDKLREGLEDLASLEVRTFSGDYKVLINAQGSAGKDFKQLADEGIKKGTLTLQLMTRLDADGDSDHFFASGEVGERMLASHLAAFKLGQEIRQGYLEMFRTLAQDTILHKPGGGS